MAASTIGFETDRTSVHQVLAVRPDRGSTGLALRPEWSVEPEPRDAVDDRVDRIAAT